MARLRTYVNTYTFQCGTMNCVAPRKQRETSFARALRALMDRQRWSNREAAEALGVSHTQIGRYLAGAEPSIARAAAIARLLGVSLDELAELAPPPDRSHELAGMAVGLGKLATAQAAIANELQATAERLSHLAGPAADQAAGTG